MFDDKAKTRVPLNSPMHKDRNPSFRANKMHESKYQAREAVWAPGNSALRRYANGMLDIQNAVSKVIEAMGKLRDGGYVNEMEKCVLSLVIPGMDMLVPRAVAATKIRLSPEEILKIRMLVAAKNNEMLNYNGGRGGGSTPMRTMTVG